VPGAQSLAQTCDGIVPPPIAMDVHVGLTNWEKPQFRLAERSFLHSHFYVMVKF
jgi:hypothetical protein